MRARILFLSAAMLAALGAPAETPLPSGARIQEILDARVAQGRAAGIVAGIVEADGARRVFVSGSSGRSGVPLNGDTVFEIGSATKVFTATLLADMVLRQEVSIIDPVSKFLPPEVKVPSRNGRPITLLDLATHRSGLPGLPDNFQPADPRNPYADYTVAQLYEFLSSHQLASDPGSAAQYSNAAMGLLGHALARKAGLTYEELIRRRVLTPLGMRDTAIRLTPALRARLAQPVDELGDPASEWEIRTLEGAGGLHSTANDMLRFLAAQLSRDSGALHTAMKYTHSPRAEFPGPGRIGLNWLIQGGRDRTLLLHGGATGGFRTFIGLDPERRRGVVILASGGHGVRDLGTHLLDPSTPLDPAPARLAIISALRDGGVEAASLRARALRKESEPGWRFDEEELSVAAFWLFRNRRLDEAIALSRLNAELFPNSPRPYANLARFYRSKDDKSAALDAYRKLLQMTPEDEEVRKAIAELEKP